MSYTPLVTIGLPIYNAERYLRQALDSLLAQTFQDFELIISDNGSTDATARICQEYAARDDRIRCCRHETNRGAIWNYNFTVKQAQGKYFKWAAHDDLHKPTFLQQCVHLLEMQPDVVWCHSLTHHMTADGHVIPPAEDTAIINDAAAHSLLLTGGDLPAVTRGAATASQRFLGVLLGTTWCADAFGLIRTEALRQTRLLLPCYGSEKVLCGELALLGRYAEVPEVLFLERLHQQASASLQTAAAQQSFVLGDQKKPRTSTRWALLSGHLSAALRARISLWQKLACLTAVLRYVCQFRKWKTVLSMMRNRSVVGADRRTEHEVAAGAARPV